MSENLSRKQKLALLEWRLRNIFRKPYYFFVRRPLRKLQQIFGQNDFVPSGHFYSPVPNKLDIKEAVQSVNYDTKDLRGINLETEKQLALLQEFSRFYKEMPFSESGNQNLRYRLDNGYYAYGDGITLYSMIRYLKPKRIIEIGSGFSSSVMHDTNELFFATNRGGGQ